MDPFSRPSTAALSSTASQSFSSSHALSSISSLSSSISSARQSSIQISKTYRQASTLFLTRRLPEALSTVLPLITPTPAGDVNGAAVIEPAPVVRASRTTRIKVWSLYLTILNAIVELAPDEAKEAFGSQEWRAICAKVREGEVWEEVARNGYHGIEGEVDSEVVINLYDAWRKPASTCLSTDMRCRATLLLAHARDQRLNQRRLESYLAAANAPNLDISDRFNEKLLPRPAFRHRSPQKVTSGADTPRHLNARVKILELYTLHVLLRNNEWDYAREFISMSSVLDEERREAFLQALHSLQEEQQEADRREREDRQHKEEQLRLEIEESRRLRAANEEHERSRLEEDRARRQRGGVDYGTEQTDGVRHFKDQPGISRPLPAPAKKGQGASVSSRAVMVYFNLRTYMARMGASFQSNPMALTRTLAFIIGFILMLSRRNVRERIARVLSTSWNKVKATAGMGLKVSYI